ncbi:MAG TPA: hypothetical protein VN739_10940, partial [Nitrososphaerales archaeon]|nr:hypothetical protein [Nitrososphaerales archaeon]
MRNQRDKTIATIVLAIILVSTIITFHYSSSPTYVIVSADSNSIGMQSYRIVQYPLPKNSSQPWGITVDASGRVWFDEAQSNQIGMFDPLSKAFSEFNVPTHNSLLEEITTDGAGNLWFTELNGERLGELNSNSGTIREF